MLQQNRALPSEHNLSLSNQQLTTESLLVARFAMRPVIPFTEALSAISYHVATARNQRAQGKFPIRVVERGARLFIELPDLIRFVTCGKPKKGRKSKDEKFAALGGAR